MKRRARWVALWRDQRWKNPPRPAFFTSPLPPPPQVCGHAGRVKVFPSSDDPNRPTPSYFHTVTFDADSEPKKLFAGYAALVKIVRTTVLLHEMKLSPGKVAEVDEHDSSSKHVLGMIGDAPAAYVRWRPVPEALLFAARGAGAPASPTGPPSGVAFVIDRLLVLKPYRNRKFGKAVLQEALRSMAEFARKVNQPTVRACLFVAGRPEFGVVAALCLKVGLNAATYTLNADPCGLVPPGETIYEFNAVMPGGAAPAAP